MTIRLSAGVSLKPPHFEEALAASADGLWFEVHPENYMVDGGPRLAWLQAIRERHPISLHGVGLSLAGEAPLDRSHLTRLSELAARINPALVSEHLAWSRWGDAYYPDLLPFPRTREALRRLVDNVDRAQTALGRPIAIENPTHYVRLDGHAWDEIDFLREVSRRTGCGLLLDVNNVFVSGNNLAFDAARYIDAFPAELVQEVHIAGHASDAAHGSSLLVDTHGAPIDEAVWALYARFVQRAGPRPTLVERDQDLPPFPDLMRERNRALGVMEAGELEFAE